MSRMRCTGWACCCAWSQDCSGAPCAYCVKTPKLRAWLAARPSMRALRASSNQPAVKPMTPQARSWPLSSLPCMKFRSATRRRVTPGSSEESAASKTTASRLPITWVKRVSASSTGTRRSRTWRRKPGSSSSRKSA
ncbi:hypothetical protein D3C72_1636600 [compost metagenome]